MNNEQKLALEISEDDTDVAYLRLEGRSGSEPGVVKQTVCLRELFGEYEGPDIYLDFDEDRRLIGIEVVR